MYLLKILYRPLDKIMYLKINVLISQPKYTRQFETVLLGASVITDG